MRWERDDRESDGGESLSRNSDALPIVEYNILNHVDKQARQADRHFERWTWKGTGSLSVFNLWGGLESWRIHWVTINDSLSIDDFQVSRIDDHGNSNLLYTLRAFPQSNPYRIGSIGLFCLSINSLVEREELSLGIDKIIPNYFLYVLRIEKNTLLSLLFC